MKLLVAIGFYIALPLVICEWTCLGEFSEAEQLPTGDLVRCFAVRNSDIAGRKFYCVQLTCPSTNCTEPIVPERGCPYCKGTCVIGDKVVKIGEGATCPDRCNDCSCFLDKNGNSMVSATRMACTFQQPPAECKNLA